MFFHCCLSNTKPNRWKWAWLQRTEQSTWEHTSKLMQQYVTRGFVSAYMDMLYRSWASFPFSNVQQGRHCMWSQSIFASIIWHAQGDTTPRLHQSLLYKELKESTEFFWGLFYWVYIKHTFHSWLYRVAYIYISCSEITGNEHQSESGACTSAGSHSRIHKGSKVLVSLVTLCIYMPV